MTSASDLIYRNVHLFFILLFFILSTLLYPVYFIAVMFSVYYCERVSFQFFFTILVRGMAEPKKRGDLCEENKNYIMLYKLG